jgi:arylsulfatase A-like enzyme
MPTLSEITGGKSPQNIDGISFTNALMGSKNQNTHEYLYWEFHEGGGKQAVRYGNWKGIRLNVLKDKNAVIALYDLSSDPQEKHDIALKHPDIAKKIALFMNEAHTESQLFPW